MRPRCPTPTILSRSNIGWPLSGYVSAPATYLEFADLSRESYQLPHPFRYLCMQHLVAILRYPHKMVHRVATISVVHAASPLVWRFILAAKANRLKPVVYTL